MAWTEDLYAYVLGLYLGDGTIARGARTYSLRLVLDRKYPGIIAEAQAALQAAFSHNRVSLHYEGERRTESVLVVYSAHLPCLFPQHGPGRKHERRIRLEAWQQTIAHRAPWALLRGLIQSDGCRFENRTGAYVYPSYDFFQISADIRQIFVSTCELVGVRCRSYDRRVRVYERASVALLDAHVGPKA